MAYIAFAVTRRRGRHQRVVYCKGVVGGANKAAKAVIPSLSEKSDEDFDVTESAQVDDVRARRFLRYRDVLIKTNYRRALKKKISKTR